MCGDSSRRAEELDIIMRGAPRRLGEDMEGIWSRGSVDDVVQRHDRSSGKWRGKEAT